MRAVTMNPMPGRKLGWKKRNLLAGLAAVGLTGCVSNGADSFLSSPWTLTVLFLIQSAVIGILIINILARRRANRLLEEARRRTQMVEQAAHMGTFDWNLETGEDRWTVETEALYGLPPGGFGGTQADWEKFIHPEDKEAALAKVQLALQSGQPVEDEWRIIRPDGSLRWLYGRYQAHYDPDGKPHHLTGINLDITDRKEHEEQVQYQNFLMAQVSDAVIATDLDFNIRFWNATAERLYGWKSSEAIGKRLIDVLPIRFIDSDIESSIREVFETGLWTGEVIQLHRDGHPIYLQANVAVIKDPLGRPVQIAAVNRDITEKKQAEQALRESEERYRAIFEQASVGVNEIETATGRFLRMNPRAREIYGLPPGAPMPETFMEISHPYDLNVDLDLMRKLVQGEIPSFAMDKRFIRPDGSIVWTRMTVSPLRTEDGNICSHITFLQDITERKQAELALQESEERYRAIFEQASIGVTETDSRTGVFLRINRKAREIGGIPEGVNTPVTFMDISHPEDLKVDLEFMEKMKRGEIDSFSMDKRYLHADGKTVWARLTVSPLRNADGTVHSHISILEDITERKQAELALRESEERFRTVGQLVSEWATSFRVLPDGSTQREWVAGSYDQVTGMTAEERDARGGWTSLIHPDDRSMVLQIFPRVIKTKKSEVTEYRVIDKAGNIHWTRNYIHPVLDASGEHVVRLIGAGQDITAAKRAEDALRESEERFRLLFDRSPIGAALVSLDHRFLRVNDELCRITGYSAEELTELKFEQIAHPDEMEADLQNTRKLLDRQLDHYEMDKRYIRKDGSLVWIRLVVRLMEDAQGNPLYFLPTMEDVTVRKQAETALRESEKRLRTIFDASRASIFLYDREGEISFANQYMADQFHCSLENLEGHSYLNLVHSDERETAQTNIRKIFNQEIEAILTERHFVRPDGTRFWGLVSVRPMINEQGRPEILVGIITDITDRKEAEIKLRDSEQRLTLALKAANAGTWEWNLETDQNIWSEDLWRLYELDPGRHEASYQSWLEAIHPDDREATVNATLATANAGAELVTEWRVNKSGPVRWLLSKGQPVRDGTGKVVRYLGVVIDITERKKIEEEIQLFNEQLEQRVEERTAQLQSLNRELEGFAYSVSHDLRAPLRAIGGFSQILIEDFPDKLGSEGKRLLEVITRNVQRMDEMVTALLNLSRVTRSELANFRVDMNGLVQSALDELTSPEVRSTFQIDIGVLPPVYGDAALLRQVWFNLISNAIKYTLPRQERRIEIRGEIHDDRNVYTVRDSGIGFDPQFAGRMFTPFQRLHNAERFEGLGVGLSIVRSIVNRHGGEVWAEGDLNEGATFSFSLPNQSRALVRKKPTTGTLRLE